MIYISLLAICLSMAFAKTAPIMDNILFAFERCKSLSVDLEKGQLKEMVTSSFDLHCIKSKEDSFKLSCNYFDTGSNKKIKTEVFTGGSEYGSAELVNPAGSKIRFLIGKKFAAYESMAEPKVCAGIFIFEQDALKQKSSSLKSGL